MEIPQLVLTPFGILMIVIGILQQNKGFVEWNIKWSNSLKGIKTQITKQSLMAQKVTGIVFILLGIFLLAMAFVIIPSLTPSSY